MKIKTFNHQTIDVNLPPNTETADLVALPALIDPHVHFRTPGHEYKENWESGAVAARAGGITTVFDMPNNNPSAVDASSLRAKKELIERQLKKGGVPLRYYLYFGATNDNLDKIEEVKDEIIGIKLFMGSSTGNLLVDQPETQEKWFAKAAQLKLVLAVHAEDEAEIQKEKTLILNPTVRDHSKIRSRRAVLIATARAIALAKKYSTKLYLCHVSTKEEVNLIRQAKTEDVLVFAEVAPHHLFLNENDYEQLGSGGQMNPPLRTIDDNLALWKAIGCGIIDTIGSDHAPHTSEEKTRPYPQSPSGVPGLETMLPLLLNAYHQGKITLEKIVALTHQNIQKIFNLPTNNDWVIVDLKKEKTVQNEELKTKCRWSPFAGQKLRGWPIDITSNHYMKHLISLKEQNRGDLLEIINLALDIKRLHKSGGALNILPNRTLIMLFQKTSTRTRLSFEAGMTELGGHGIYLDARNTQFALTDYGDEIRAVMRYGDIMTIRALKADDVVKAASYNQIPVIDACSEKYHPCQALGDILTMIEHSKGLGNIKKITWLGIENNVSNTLKLACVKLGIQVAIAAPEANPASVDTELNIIAEGTGNILKTLNISEALKNSDYVHTDTWMDMEFFENGKVKEQFISEYERRKQLFMPYQLNAQVINTYAPNAKIMHCMPCHIGYEITRDAIDHPNSIIFDQAENRRHIQKAIILWLLNKNI